MWTLEMWTALDSLHSLLTVISLYFYRPELTQRVRLSHPTPTVPLLTACCPPTLCPQVKTSPLCHPKPHLQLICQVCPPPAYPSAQKSCSSAVKSAAIHQTSPQGALSLLNRLLRLLQHGRIGPMERTAVPLRTHTSKFQPPT